MAAPVLRRYTADIHEVVGAALAETEAQVEPNLGVVVAAERKKGRSKSVVTARIGQIDVAALNATDRSLREQAYERLLDMLLSGKLLGGSPLQERRLADTLKISRTPVREALRQLETEGLVMRQMGRLMTVLQISVQDYIEILNIRKLLEVETAGLAAGRISKTTADAMRKAVRDLMEDESPSASRHWQVDDLVHYTIAEAAGNKLLTTMIRDLRRRTHIFNTRRIPDRRRPGALEHLALIDAVAAGDAQKAQTLMAEHIENVKSSIIQQVVSVANRQEPFPRDEPAVRLAAER
jgi:DNA-binding GntR family transcriptional regulator